MHVFWGPCIFAIIQCAIALIEPKFHALKHRYSFNFDFTSSTSQNATFQVEDTVEILKIAGVTLQAAKFDLESTRVNVEGTNYWPKAGDSSDGLKVQTRSSPGRLEPNVTDKQTIVNLAKMTSDAYLADPNNPNWFNTSFGFNFTRQFGWHEDGLRGHIFATDDDRSVVVSFKGTTIYPRGKLSERDRINDVALFSCCCGAQHPYHYSPVCNCSSARNECNSDCLATTILQNETYYDAALYLMARALAEFPVADFWVVGHSLGGSVASLVGMSLDIPAVTFEAPPERLPAQRMGLLPFEKSAEIGAVSNYHFGNSADPVYVGSCQGFLSTCSLAGFAFETQCHSGRRCEYDTVRDKGWHVTISNHRIDYVIANVLEAYDTLPNCTEVTDCVDCVGWNFS